MGKQRLNTRRLLHAAERRAALERKEQKRRATAQRALEDLEVWKTQSGLS